MENGFVIRDFNAAETIFANEPVTVYQQEVYRAQTGGGPERDPERYVGIATAESSSYSQGTPVPILVLGGYGLAKLEGAAKRHNFLRVGDSVGRVEQVDLPTSVPLAARSEEDGSVNEIDILVIL